MQGFAGGNEEALVPLLQLEIKKITKTQ